MQCLGLTRWRQPSRSLPARRWPPRSSRRGRGSYRSCGRFRGPWWPRRRWTAPNGPVGNLERGLFFMSQITLIGVAVPYMSCWPPSSLFAPLSGHCVCISHQSSFGNFIKLKSIWEYAPSNHTIKWNNKGHEDRLQDSIIMQVSL